MIDLFVSFFDSSSLVTTLTVCSTLWLALALFQMAHLNLAGSGRDGRKMSGVTSWHAAYRGFVLAGLSTILFCGMTSTSVADPVKPPESSSKDGGPPHESDAPQWTLQRLPRSIDSSDKKLSPDRQLVACLGSHFSDAGRVVNGLFVVELESGRVRCLLERNIKNAPAWSPDSRRLVLGNAEGYVAHYPLILVDVASGEIETTKVMGVGAAWSPDGTEIALSTEIQRGGSWAAGVPIDGRIGIYNVNDRTMRHVTPAGIYAYSNNSYFIAGAVHPVWSPDGKWIAFELMENSRRGEQKIDRREIWAVNRQRTEMRSLSKVFKPYQWASNSDAILFEEGESVLVANASIVSESDWPKATADLVEKPNELAMAFDPKAIFARNKPWQSPDVAHLKSVEFVHHMASPRLDERFSWRADGAFSVETVRSDDPNIQKNVGRISLITPEGEELTLAAAGHYPKRQTLENARKHQEALGHLMGTRFNAAALDWGRLPSSFDLKGVRPANDRGEIVLTLVPKQDRQRRNYRLNFGAMFHSMSYGYIHDLIIVQSELTVEEKSGRIVKEVDTTQENQSVVFEFTDWQDIDNECSIPLAVNVSYPAQKFHAEYKFRWIREGLWLLKSGKSWFDDKDPLNETVIDLVVNKTDPIVDRHMEQFQSQLTMLESKQKALALAQQVRLNPFQLGENFPLQWSRPNAATGRIESVRFTVIDQNKENSAWPHLSVQLEVELKASDEPISAPAGQLVLYDNEGRPVDVYSLAWETAELVRRPEQKEVLRFDLGNSRSWLNVRQWSLTTPAEREISVAKTPSSKGQACEAISIHGNQVTPIYVLGPKSSPSGEVETWLREMQLERRDDGRVIGTIELVSRSYGTMQHAMIAAVLLDGAGVPIAAADIQKEFRVENDVYSDKVTLDFGVILSEVEAAKICLGFNLIWTGTMTGSVMLASIDPSPTVSANLLLASQSPEIIEIGLKELYRAAHRDIRRVEGRHSSQEYLVMTGVAPYSNRMEQLFAMKLKPEALAILCRLAGHSGQTRFVRPLDNLRTHPNADVQDSAAVGLGLLGYSRELSRLKAIYSRSNEIEKPTREESQRLNDVKLALRELRKAVGSQ